MSYTIRFYSDKFDLKNEVENSINPINGISVGEWLHPLVERENIVVSSIAEEDWGWYSYATLHEQTYLVGYAAIPDDHHENHAEVIIQIHKKRTLFEKILGKNKLQQDDSLVKVISAIAKNTKEFKDIIEEI